MSRRASRNGVAATTPSKGSRAHRSWDQADASGLLLEVGRQIDVRTHDLEAAAAEVGTAAAQAGTHLLKTAQDAFEKGRSDLEVLREVLPKDHVPLLDSEVVLDDQNASYVFVFTRSKGAGGVVYDHAKVEEPLKLIRQIFKCVKTSTVDATDAGFPELEQGPVSSRVYQSVVRAKFLEIVNFLGLQAKSFESIDGDEVFLKVSLPRDGDAIRHLACRLQYRMPVTEAAYRATDADDGKYEGHRDANGTRVPGFAAYAEHLSDCLETFRQVDEIRIIEHFLREWVRFPTLIDQQILSEHFPAANHAQLMQLHNDWGRLCKYWWHRPNQKHDDQLRDYFGEDVAFFFQWLSFFTNMMMPMAVLGGFAAIRRIELFGLSVHAQRYIQISYGFVMICWASVFNKLHKRESSRTKWRWGMDDYETTAADIPSHDPNIVGTWQLEMRKAISAACSLAFMLAFVACVSALHLSSLGTTHHRFSSYVPYITTALIRCFSLAWGTLSPWLTKLHNQRTYRQYETALVYRLVPAKLFFALYPFVVLAFFKKYAHMTCADTLPEAAYKLYHEKLAGRWPVGVEIPTYTQQVIEGELRLASNTSFSFLRHTDHETHDHKVCLYGCYPISCAPGDEEGGPPICMTNCTMTLEHSLLIYFLSHCACTIVFVAIPIFLARAAIQAEQNKQREAGESYTFLQLQAKQPGYEYLSWGGSKVDDFLECAINFAMVVSFSSVLPVMTVPAFFCSVFEYRLLAYRMTTVTRRPFPKGAEGIGVWSDVFEGVCLLAIAINAGVIVIVMYPIRNWTPLHALGAFISLEHCMVFLYASITNFVPNEPDDILHIAQYNRRFLARLLFRAIPELPSQELRSCSRVNLSLGPPSDVDMVSSCDCLTPQSDNMALTAEELEQITAFNPTSPLLSATPGTKGI